MQTVQHTFTQTPDWTAEWFRRQYLDPSLDETEGQNLMMDVVYTWVNGSDPRLMAIKEEYQNRSPFFQGYRSAEEDRWARFRLHGGIRSPAAANDQTANRFRDMNELKYSVRSVHRYFSRSIFNRIHVLTTAVEDSHGAGEVQVQVPSWLDLEGSRDRVRMVAHGNIFDNSSDLPSFNSLAIESQMHHIPDVTDVFLYLNDDVFLGLEMAAADIWTPLYGFVFHMEPTLLVPPTILPLPQHTLSIGEWNSLQFSNHLLSRQFGARHRAYLAHVPHVLCTPMLKEIQSLWPEEFAQTSSHRFRGEGQAQDIQVSFFMAHYVMERLRETQLASFWNYRLDANLDGTLDWAERSAFVDRVREWNRGQGKLVDIIKGPLAYVYVNRFNNSLKGHEVNLQRLGFPRTGSSDYKLSGLDGYPFMIQPNDNDLLRGDDYIDIASPPPVPPSYDSKTPYLSDAPLEHRLCHIDIHHCLGPQFLDPSIPTIDKTTSTQIFEDFAFSKFQCGDCLLHMLLQPTSTTYPTSTTTTSSSSSSSPPKPTSNGLGAEILPLNTQSPAYRRVIADMSKYNFVVATSSYSFVQLQEPANARTTLDNIRSREYVEAFFCINDNAGENPKTVHQIREIFANFLEARFPTSSPWEKE
ncbi:Xanthine phosphoribosyltransferase 1 [Linnemannia exigua]|uniref:Xanthine phosphoribosyltransferase 1 n=1 Tax=Linnemannia exigua TaxID=604196 RepID=A0AAD4D6U1_9FUNG|nr:Xanthine phosphoribosyltransferase 1 [Linnemannia exigua]